MNCVGSVYSNQKSVGSVTIGLVALAVAERNSTDAPISSSAYLAFRLFTLHTEGCINFVCFEFAVK